MKLRPINSNAFLLEEKETVTKGGIVLPETGNTKTGIFMIHSIGKNEWGLKAGMMVLASKYAGEEVEIREGEKTTMLKCCAIDTILAIVNV